MAEFEKEQSDKIYVSPKPVVVPVPLSQSTSPQMRADYEAYENAITNLSFEDWLKLQSTLGRKSSYVGQSTGNTTPISKAQIKHEQDAVNYNNTLRVFGLSNLTDDQARRNPEQVASIIDNTKKEAAWTLASLYPAARGFNWLRTASKPAYYALNTGLTGVSARDWHQNGPSFMNVTGTLLGGLGIGAELATEPTITSYIARVNQTRKWNAARSNALFKLETGQPLTEQEYNIVVGIAGGGIPSNISRNDHYTNAANILKSNAYEYYTILDDKYLQHINEHALRNKINLNDFDLTKIYFNSDKGGGKYSRIITDATTGKKVIATSGIADFPSVYYKLVRGMDPYPFKSYPDRTFYNLGVTGKLNNRPNSNDGRALAADVRAQAFMMGKLNNDHFESRFISYEDFTPSDLLNYLNNAHGGRYASDSRFSIRGFIQDPKTKKLKFDPNLSKEDIDKITNNWRKAMILFKQGGIIQRKWKKNSN